MKILSFAIIIALMTMVSFANAQVQSKPPNTNSQTYEAVPYRLYATTNTWNFIKLDTRNGKMWQVQWSTKSEERFTTDLSLISLVAKEDEKNGRFTLQPTQNIYNFILIDQLDGRVWQVQWSFDRKDRVVIPID
ncbi:MAG: hypothetical protein V4456_12565 [Bacteroidota bacterium]